MSSEWIDCLKAGDEVIVKSGYGSTTRRLAKVERLTATQIIVSVYDRPVRYWKAGGQRVGGDWSQRLEELTPDARDSLRRLDLIDRLSGVKWGAHDLATLEQVAAIALKKRTPTETSKP